MKVGTRSVLYGVHAFWFHPFTVLLACIKLDGIPNWKEIVCIFLHDLGYFGKNEMDGPEGETHPDVGAKIAGRLFGKEYHDLCLYHSRTTAKKYCVDPSKMCWWDKLSILYDPSWFYILRATLSGEIEEYRKAAADFDAIPIEMSNMKWISWAKERMIRKALAKDVRPPYEVGS